MRHGKRSKKLGRSSAHRRAMLASLVGALIGEKRIETTLAKAKEARRLAEKMVTLGRRGTLAARRRAVSVLRREDRVATLFGEIAPQFGERQGGYTRVIRLGRRRRGDGSERAVLEWVGIAPAPRKKRKKKTEEAQKAEAR